MKTSEEFQAVKRRFDHIDLRVPQLREVVSFYEALLPALGFSRRVNVEGWLQFEAADSAITEFFGITESADHIPNENRIAFWAESQLHVDRLAKIAATAGARNIEGPMDYEPGYYAVFFEDPCGNRFEICHRRSMVPNTGESDCFNEARDERSFRSRLTRQSPLHL